MMIVTSLKAQGLACAGLFILAVAGFSSVSQAEPKDPSVATNRAERPTPPAHIPTVPPSSTTPPSKPPDDTVKGEAKESPPKDESDPCEQAQPDKRVECVRRFSKALADVCPAQPEQLKEALVSAAKRTAEREALTALAESQKSGAPQLARKPKAFAEVSPVELGDADNALADHFDTNVCKVLCPESTASMSLCQMDDVVATAVAASAWSEVQTARKLVAKELNKSPTLSATDKVTAQQSKLGVLREAVTKGTSLTAAVPVLDSTQAAAVFLQGLGKLIVDRAKAEAVGWLLDTVGRDLCGEGDDETKVRLEQLEIRKYWLPSVCALAAERRLSGYGGGAAMLEGLRRAIESDLEYWPGAGASFAPAALYVDDLLDAQRPTLIIECDRSPDEKHATTATCRAVTALRTATREGVTDMLKGHNPLASLYDLSTKYREANGPALKSDGTTAWQSDKLQVMACALGLPRDVHEVDKAAETVLSSDAERAHAAVLASLVTVPACFDIVQVAPITTKDGVKNDRTAYNRLDTLFSLEDHVGGLAAEARHKLLAVGSAATELTEALKALEKSSDKLLTVPVPGLPADQDPATVLDTLNAYHSGMAKGIMGPAELRVLRALVGLADAGVAFGQTGVDIAKGACASLKRLDSDCSKDLDQAKGQLDEVRRYVSIASEAVNGDWSKSALSVLAAARASNHGGARAFGSDRRLLRHVGLLIAIATARDSDGVANALDAAAAPVGSWRGKGVPGSTTYSITAHAGLYGARELRHGTYGADYENWHGHWQVPTLALPVGLELAKGTRCFVSPIALFVPLLDPAAFLQYDAEKDGKLPGASIKTALSPGLGFRLGIEGTPFSVIPQVVYRPGFRQWTSNLSGTGADAVQFGLLFSVDVTLFQLSHSETFK